MSRAHMMAVVDGKWAPYDPATMSTSGPSYGGPEGTEEVGAYKTTVGDGTASSFVVHHGFGTKDVSVTVFGTVEGVDAQPGITRSSEDEITIDFGSFVPPPDSVRVIVAGIA